MDSRQLAAVLLALFLRSRETPLVRLEHLALDPVLGTSDARRALRRLEARGYVLLEGSRIRLTLSGLAVASTLNGRLRPQRDARAA